MKQILNTITLLMLGVSVHSAPLLIDLTTQSSPPATAPYGPGTSKNPQGQTITADSQSFFLNGQPWIPILGEFHYARYPRDEWRDELLKMKAGGINTVSTYVFWIHHEEEKDKWDWSGQRSLRDFLKLAQEVGLKAFVRMGPWCHGEVRNGGFPDWVQKSGTRLRTNDPAFLKLVEPLFAEEARQMQGLLWKDGGPVIGIQLDNECDKADYLLALKTMARAAGVDVPFYAITGWQGGLPRTELIPLFGGYTDGFWGGSHEGYRKEFVFTNVRAVNDLGAQMTNKNPSNAELIGQFPYACVEIGGGMMSAYGKRIKILPENIAALALAKLGCGNNMPGYYMYQGGINPEGRLSYLHEDHPNQLPVKDYDFQAPLGACGQVREQYHLLRRQHLFLQDFGAALARMTAYFPEHSPRDLKDFETVRWDVRSDGKSGFLFYSNQQPYEALPEHKDVQFEIKTGTGSQLVPLAPITIPSGSYGIWPLRLNCGGVVLDYATAQPLCHVSAGKADVYFFTALDGIAPELLLESGGSSVTVTGAQKEPLAGRVRVFNIVAGTLPAATVVNKAGVTVAFVVLTPEQGRQFYRLPFAGQERAILSSAPIFADGAKLRAQDDSAKQVSVAMFPQVASINMGGMKVAGMRDGIFARMSRGVPFMESLLAVTQEKQAGQKASSLKGNEEAAWNDAAVYKIESAAPAQRALLNIAYIGDAARVYSGDKLICDNYYNGDPFTLASWRILPEDWPRLRLKVLPYSEGLMGWLPEQARRQVEQAKASGSLDKVSMSATSLIDLSITP